MRFRSRAIALVGIGLVLLPAVPAAAKTAGSDIVIIRQDEVVDEDLYTAGYRVEVHGTIEGDLVAAATNDILIDGIVTGSVTAIASEVTISGEIHGSVRVVARTVVIDGAAIHGDLAVTAWTVSSTGDVGRDVFVFARDLMLGGTVGRLVKGNQNRTTLDGVFARDVETSTSHLIITDRTRIEGSLLYQGDPRIEGNFEGIEGSVVKRTSLPANVRIRAMFLFGKILAALVATLLGLLVLWTFRRPVQRASLRLGQRPLPALALGLFGLLSPVALIALLLFFLSKASPESALPMALIFAPVILAVVGLILLMMALAPITVAVVVGGFVLKDRSAHARFLVGMAMIGLLLLVRPLAILAVILVSALGVGSWLLDEAPEPDHYEDVDAAGEILVSSGGGE